MPYKDPEKRKQADRKWREANRDKLRDARKAYCDAHREEIRKQNRERAHTNTGREKNKEAARRYRKANAITLRERDNERNRKMRDERANKSETVTAKQAALMLGVSPQAVLDMIKRGELPSTKTKTRRHLIPREAVQQFSQKASVSILRTTGIVVPDGFDCITQYKELTEYTLAFAAGNIGFLLLVGSPGSGKSKQMQADLSSFRHKWIDNHATNLGLYCAVYEAGGCPVVLDDVNHFLNNMVARSLIKALTQTDEKRNVSWESTSKILDIRDVPRQYSTSSPICMIGNRWETTNDDWAAIQDRSLPVAFYPSGETIHARVIELGWCKDSDIIRFIGDNLSDIPQPSMREYYNAMRYKRAGMDWRQKLRAVWEQ